MLATSQQEFDDQIATEVGAHVDQDNQVAEIEQGIVSDTEASFMAPQLQVPTIPASVRTAIRDAALLNIAQSGQQLPYFALGQPASPSAVYSASGSGRASGASGAWGQGASGSWDDSVLGGLQDSISGEVSEFLNHPLTSISNTLKDAMRFGYDAIEAPAAYLSVGYIGDNASLQRNAQRLDGLSRLAGEFSDALASGNGYRVGQLTGPLVVGAVTGELGEFAALGRLSEAATSAERFVGATNSGAPTLVTRSVGNNSVSYTLDANGDTLSASGNLQEYFSGGVRSSAEVQAQANAAATGLVTDQGGHIVGYRFLPEQGDINLFPQDGNFNMSAFKTIENDYARYIDQGYQVDFTHTLSDFDPITGRPGSLAVNFDVTGANGNLIDTFADKFLNQPGQVYVRRAR